MKLTTPQRLVAVALLGIFFAQTVTAIPQLSLTADEPVYMGAGYAFLQSKDLRLATSAQHPPFMQELVALPLFLQPGPELKSLAGWDTAEMVRYAPAFVAWYGDALDAATFVARMPVVWVAILWAAFLFRWAADWFGPCSSLIPTSWPTLPWRPTTSDSHLLVSSHSFSLCGLCAVHPDAIWCWQA